jgi:hypothetical protein
MKNGVFWVVTPHGVTTQKTPFFILMIPLSDVFFFRFMSNCLCILNLMLVTVI